jgi:hypothetical protein
MGRGIKNRRVLSPWRSCSGQKRDSKRSKPSEMPVVNRELDSWDGNGSPVEEIREAVRPDPSGSLNPER